MKLKKTLAASLVIAAMTAMSAASAQTVRIGNQGDALSMDPHSLERIAAAERDQQHLRAAGGPRQKPQPGARWPLRWKQTSPTVWRFELRKGVQISTTAPFTADDVLFSFNRAAGDGSDMKSYTNDDQGSAQGQRPRDRDRNQGAVSDPARRDVAVSTS
jgi:peptide/nickel transport system substrate-binding protein